MATTPATDQPPTRLPEHMQQQERFADHVSGPEAFRRAVQVANRAADLSPAYETHRNTLLAEAQVWATLAHAAAVVDADGARYDSEAWANAMTAAVGAR